MNWAAIIWLILVVVFLLTEAATVTVTSLWFAAGALVALIISLFHGGVWLQLAAFLAVSVFLLWMLRPIVKKHFTPRLTPTNIDAIIGKSGITVASVNNLLAQGTVKIDGMQWSARSTNGEEIPADTQVRVDRVEGVKLFVSPVEVPVK